ncbi:MAG: SLOG family protein [Bradymonadaceae bacterium]
MRTVISGSRSITRYDYLKYALEHRCGWEISKILCGDADGVDQLAQRYARERDIELDVFEADWENYGKAAGPRRNSEMVGRGEALVALWDGESNGTQDTINKALREHLTVLVCQTQPTPPF